MNNLMSTLLATDKIAQHYGCRLKPELRAALESDLRFPSRASTPLSQEGRVDGNLPDNVVRIQGVALPEKRITA